MNILIDSKFNEIKNVFVHETKGLFIKEMKDEMKKLFTEEFENQNWNQQKDASEAS